MHRLAITVLLALALSPLLAADNAKNEMAKPPRPGAWARYQGRNKSLTEPEVTFTVTYRALNDARVNDVPCRWFELEDVSDLKSWHSRRKYLISEQGYRTAERPFDYVLKYLQRNDTDPVTAVDPDNEGWMPHEFLYFPGFLKTAKLVDAPRTVNYQNGTLTVPQAYSGTYKWQRKGRDPNKTVLNETKYQVWMHPDLPIGFPHAKLRLESSREGKVLRVWEIEYSLQDFGHDAKPAIVEEDAPPQAR